MQDVYSVILSQYANSPPIIELIETFNENIDPSVDIDLFYTNIMDVMTAKGPGLDIWGRIVVVNRVLKIPKDRTYFGFEDSGRKGFGQDPFFRQTFAVTDNYILNDDAYRLLILAKSMLNISDGSLFMYNKILMLLFSGNMRNARIMTDDLEMLNTVEMLGGTREGNAYVVTTGTKTADIVFEFSIEPFELAILQQSGAFEPPAGVAFSIVTP